MPVEAFAFLKHPAAPGEAAALHVDADSFDPAVARPLRIAALRLNHGRIMAGCRVELTCPDGAPPHQDEVIRLLRLIGGRPVLGFFIDFSMAMLDRLAAPLTGGPLGNPRIEVSSVYYESKPRVPGKTAVDLRLASVLQDLDLPPRAEAAATATALASAMIWLRVGQRRG